DLVRLDQTQAGGGVGNGQRVGIVHGCRESCWSWPMPPAKATGFHCIAPVLLAKQICRPARLRFRAGKNEKMGLAGYVGKIGGSRKAAEAQRQRRLVCCGVAQFVSCFFHLCALAALREPILRLFFAAQLAIAAAPSVTKQKKIGASAARSPQPRGQS